NTLHQNNVAGDYAEVSFNGAQVKLTYLKAPNRGSIDVYIDGTKVVTLNASNASIVWQSTWTSPVLSTGVHTIRFVNAGGGWNDLDALQIL
ncbi:MAG TPA: hypothetical protein VLE49_19510, partial [Anaerolineales bacterium]|nr:hypothetical protein [Anaerolineales bacterium]